MTPFRPEVLKAIEACRAHAQDAYDGAKLLRENGKPNLAYHLATIALEELGKAHLIGMHSFAKDDADSWYSKQIDDHVKKIFWALWGQLMGAGRPDPKEIEQLRGTANIIHENRLRGLYVDPNPDNFVAPSDAINETVLDPLMALVSAKLALNPSLEGVEYRQEDLELLNWFSNVTNHPEKRKFIFSKHSFDKMAEIGTKDWLPWVKGEVDRFDAEAAASIQKELNRRFTPDEEGLEYKWDLKIRIYSQSHSIRPKPLNSWNDRVEWIKLYPINNKKNYLDAVIKIPKFVTIHGVYYIGFGYSNILLAALNIASGGFFWWQEPRNLSTFFESILDREDKMICKIGRSPELKIGWPPAVVDEALLDRAMMLFAAMPQPQDDQEKSEPISHYMTAIALLAKTDVFLQFEVQSYMEFVAAITSALKLYQPEVAGTVPTDMNTLLAAIDDDDPFKIKHTALLAHLESRTLPQGSITLSEVAAMKQLSEAILTSSLVKRLQQRAKKEAASEE